MINRCKFKCIFASDFSGRHAVRVALATYLLVSCMLFVAAPVSFAADKKKESDSEIWEFSPYNLRVLVAYDFFPQYSDELHERIVRDVPELASVDDPSGWRLTVERMPAQWRYSYVRDPDAFAFTEDELTQPMIEGGDKLMLVGISQNEHGLHVATREYDCRARQYTSVVHREVVSLDQLPVVVYRSIRQAFIPMARVVNVEGKTVSALLRAGGLLLSESETDPGKMVFNTGSPAWIPEKSICSPFSRRAVRRRITVEQNGKEERKTVTVSVVTPIDWTYGIVNELTNMEKEPILVCELHSAMRSPLGGSRGSRTERVLRLCKPNYEKTSLSLTDRQKPTPQPVAGYKIYEVIPGNKPAPESLAGRTDYRGGYEMEIQPDQPMMIVYVFSGSRSLARLPIVPGLSPELTAAMYNDAVRIRAEGIVKAMQSNLVNLIAQRQSIAVQIRNALGKGEVEQAEVLMEVFGDLQSGEDFVQDIEAQAATLGADDPKQQRRIDAMFNEIRKLVLTYLTADLNVKLTEEIAYVREGGDYSDIKPDPIDHLKELEENE